jgi:hypothetical protein
MYSSRSPKKASFSCDESLVNTIAASADLSRVGETGEFRVDLKAMYLSL